MRLDGYLRRLYKHTDSYLRSVNAMCEASKLLADDFAEALEAYPALRGMLRAPTTIGADRRGARHHLRTTSVM